MSYDIDYCTEDDQEQFEGMCSVTWNLGPIFRAAIGASGMPDGLSGGINAFNGLTGKKSEPYLSKAVAWMDDPANTETVDGMLPENGWGTLDGARRTLCRMLRWGRAVPDGTYYI